MSTDKPSNEGQLEVIDKQELEADAESTRPGPVFVPAVDIFEDVDGITVVADVPGAGPEGVDIDLDGGTLTIAADVEQYQVGDGESDLSREWVPGRYYRKFSLSDRIEQSKIEAALTDGVLRIHLPKVEQAKPRKITVSAG